MYEKLKQLRKETTQSIIDYMFKFYEKSEDVVNSSSENTITIPKKYISNLKINNSHFFIKTNDKPIEMSTCYITEISFDKLSNELYLYTKYKGKQLLIKHKKLSLDDIVHIHDFLKYKYEYLFVENTPKYRKFI